MITWSRRVNPLRKHNADNERIKRGYFAYLEHAKGMSPNSIDQAAAAIALFEASTRYKEFRKFHRSQAITFKADLQHRVHAKTGKPLAKATVHSRLMTLCNFT